LTRSQLPDFELVWINLDLPLLDFTTFPLMC